MHESFLDIAAELVSLLAVSLGTLALSGIGLFVEYNSLQQFVAGDVMLGGWYAIIGIGVLMAARALGTEQLLPRIRSYLS